MRESLEAILYNACSRRGTTPKLIGEATLWQSFFLVLKLSKDSTVDLLYRAKESEDFFPCSTDFF